MSWDKKANGRAYYYRSLRRADGSTVKEYVGGGARGERAAQEDAEARLRRYLRQQRWECLWSRLETAGEPVDALVEWTKVMNRAVLVAAGYHLHKGHEWRQRSA